MNFSPSSTLEFYCSIVPHIILLLRKGYLEQPRYLYHDHTLSYPILSIPSHTILSYPIIHVRYCSLLTAGTLKLSFIPKLNLVPNT